MNWQEFDQGELQPYLNTAMRWAGNHVPSTLVLDLRGVRTIVQMAFKAGMEAGKEKADE